MLTCFFVVDDFTRRWCLHISMFLYSFVVEGSYIYKLFMFLCGFYISVLLIFLCLYMAKAFLYFKVDSISLLLMFSYFFHASYSSKFLMFPIFFLADNFYNCCSYFSVSFICQCFWCLHVSKILMSLYFYFLVNGVFIFPWFLYFHVSYVFFLLFQSSLYFFLFLCCWYFYISTSLHDWFKVDSVSLLLCCWCFQILK